MSGYPLELPPPLIRAFLVVSHATLAASFMFFIPFMPFMSNPLVLNQQHSREMS
jgi:hypothetical protein